MPDLNLDEIEKRYSEAEGPGVLITHAGKDQAIEKIRALKTNKGGE